jgi:hypothetical protein
MNVGPQVGNQYSGKARYYIHLLAAICAATLKQFDSKTEI